MKYHIDIRRTHIVNVKLEIIEDTLIAVGVAVSIDQIKTTLGVILLGLQIALILYKGIKLLVKCIKEKDVKGAIKVIDDTTEQLDNVINKDGDKQNTKER